MGRFYGDFSGEKDLRFRVLNVEVLNFAANKNIQ